MSHPRALDGVGRQAGRLRPDWGEGWADLECEQCGATWTGPIGEACAYCERALERMRRWQARLLLHPDLPERADRRYAGSLKAWGERLAVAVDAGIITEEHADRSWQRAHRGAA